MMKGKIFLVMTMKFKALLFSLALLPMLVFGQEIIDTAVAPVATELKVRMPEWRPKVFEQFPNGAPKLVLFSFISFSIERLLLLLVCSVSNSFLSYFLYRKPFVCSYVMTERTSLNTETLYSEVGG